MTRRWCKDNFAVGGKVRVPHSFKGDELAEITNLTHVGMSVTYRKGTKYEQTAFFSFVFLQQEYGDYKVVPKDDLDDEIPF